MGGRSRPMSWWYITSAGVTDRASSELAVVRADERRRAYAEAWLGARTALIDGDPSRAIVVASSAIAEYPHGIDVHRLLGIAHLELGDFHAARQAFEVTLSGDPGDVAAYVGIAEIEEKTEAIGVAYRAWQRAWDADPGSEPVAIRLREARRRLAGHVETAYGIDPAVEPPIQHTHASVMRTHMRSGLFQHAIVDGAQALAEDSSRIDVQLLLAEAWWRSGETEIAHDVSATILEVAPFCVAANLFVAVHRRVVARDPRQQVELARQADVFDRIGHMLFASRDVPPVFDDGWNGDLWTTKRIGSGEWPVVVTLPREVKAGTIDPTIAPSGSVSPLNPGPSVMPSGVIATSIVSGTPALVVPAVVGVTPTPSAPIMPAPPVVVDTPASNLSPSAVPPEPASTPTPALPVPERVPTTVASQVADQPWLGSDGLTSGQSPEKASGGETEPGEGLLARAGEVEASRNTSSPSESGVAKSVMDPDTKGDRSDEVKQLQADAESAFIAQEFTTAVQHFAAAISLMGR